jgi:hypothetical protein
VYFAQTPNVDITAYNPVTVPSGVTFEWHNALPVSSGNLMTAVTTQALQDYIMLFTITDLDVTVTRLP